MRQEARRNVVSIAEFGPPDRLKMNAVDLRPPAKGEVLVDVEAAGINYLDLYQRQGMRNLPLPFTPGLEGVGRVREIGEHIDPDLSLRVGQRIAWIDVPGSYASALIVPAARAIAVPDSLSSAECLLFQPLTAQFLVKEFRGVRAGDRVLVHAAAGGVGQLLVQWLKHLGAWVVGTTSSDAKASIVRAAGADAVINYGHDYRFVDEVLGLTEGRGVDLAFDGVGATTLVATLQALARGGTAVSFGHASGPAPPINPNQLIERCTRLAGGSIFTYVADTGELRRRSGEVITAIQEGWLRLGAGTAYELSKAADAHRAIESRQTHGKVYLRLDEERKTN